MVHLITCKNENGPIKLDLLEDLTIISTAAVLFSCKKANCALKSPTNITLLPTCKNHLDQCISNCLFVLTILSRNEILTSIYGHNFVTNLKKMPGNNPKLITLQKFYPFVLMILIGNEILTSTKGHNSVTNFQKITGSNHNLGLVKYDAYIKFCEIQSICSQAIERKQNSDINQGPSLCYEFWIE